MEIQRVNSDTYTRHFDQTGHVFNSVRFALLNETKCDKVHFLLFCDNRVRMGIILGERGDMLSSPFSAPFGSFSFSEEPHIECIEKAVDALLEYSRQQGKRLKITLPPPIYGQSFNAKTVSVLTRTGTTLAWIDLNYHFDLSRMTHYEAWIDRSARKNLKKALNCGMTFSQLDSNNPDHVTRVYNVISDNRSSHGYPLRMSLNDILSTIALIKADFFIVTDGINDIAAAQVFHVDRDIAQVIYWGDRDGYGLLRPMNFLSYNLFCHYHKSGLKMLDIGPSTEEGIPNHGLCRFKENLGCEISLKHTFIL